MSSNFVFILYGVYLSILSSDTYKFTKESCTSDTLQIFRRQINFDPLRDLHVESTKLSYYLYNSKSPRKWISLSNNNLHEVNAQIETKIIVFGYIEGHDKPWVLNMKDSYLSRNDYNVIVFGYDYYVDVPYLFAVEISLSLGKLLGNFISDLVEVINLDLNDTHLIGHSLGAHIAGIAGKEIIKRTGRKVGRISGLDAAGPLFDFNPPPRRIDVNDAHFVDALHTNGNILGYRWNYGNVDFYINGGVFQPGCTLFSDIFRIKIDCDAINMLFTCSHARSRLLWIESITAPSFIANAVGINPQNQIVMGEDCPKTASGIYAIDTNSVQPFARRTDT